ncbi:MAG: hypothetical protein GEU96_16975, partial [Propionibacteriales bacterium]|nr:hypothetical protein [Propionibacteriales bacterium]
MRSIEQSFETSLARGGSGLSVVPARTTRAPELDPFHPEVATMSSMAITRTTARSEARPEGGDLRLTHRGRLVVFATLLAVVCAALVTVAGTAIGSGEPGQPVP